MGAGIVNLGELHAIDRQGMGNGMQKSRSEIVNLSSESATDCIYDNHPVATVNDHVIRLSVMTEEYHWHCHPDSDETFLALEGGLLIDLDGETLELKPGYMFTVYRGVRHRTRPLGARSVNLTFERADAKTEGLAPPNEGTGLPQIRPAKSADCD
jgi:mannose-6-phosphate isomerase-like protein (cupin superfamily)